jgi:hypothetical protein
MLGNQLHTLSFVLGQGVLLEQVKDLEFIFGQPFRMARSASSLSDCAKAVSSS